LNSPCDTEITIERSHQRSSRIWNGGNATNTESEENYNEEIVFFVITVATGGVIQAATPEILDTKALDGGGIMIRWASEPKAVYRIEYASELADGATTFETLFEDYPSHGTNTLWTDNGDYTKEPSIKRPQDAPKRFYRVVQTGTSTSPVNPTVAITSPGNGAVLTGLATISVSASSSELLSEVRLYVDGEEQWHSDDGTNFLINTCEWSNGPHMIFAVAKSVSAIEGNPLDHTVTYGRAVSSYVNVAFSNLISKLDFSEPFFEPSEGQTQRVTATFAANVNWTLEIQDVNTNTVRYATGSGGSMRFDWDGTGTNGAVLPDGLYSYLLNAQTNGLPLGGGGGGTGGIDPPPSPTVGLREQALKAGQTSYSLPPPPMPSIKVHDVWYSWEDIFGPVPPIEVQIPLGVQEAFAQNPEGFSTVSSSGNVSTAATAANQSNRAPKRKPKVGVKNKTGTFGVCYQTCPNGFLAQAPRTGWPAPLPRFVAIDGRPATSGFLNWGTLKGSKPIADGFAQGMKLGGWKQKFVKGDSEWGPLDIQKSSLGGSNLFNSCNLGLLVTHGCFGTTSEADSVKYTYLALFDPKLNQSSYVRLSDMNFGSPGANGLKWMTILSCNMLRPENITSMANASRLPRNDNLHLLLGASTYTYAFPTLGIAYASNLVFRATIQESWINGCQSAYREAQLLGARGMTNPVTVRVMGLRSCMEDRLYQYNEPDPDTAFEIIDTPVFRP